MNQPPRKISETGLFRPVWEVINRCRDYWVEITPMPGTGIRVTRTPNGSVVSLSASRQAEGASRVSQYLLKEVLDDYLRCHLYNAGTEDNTDVFIAKPWRLRRGPFDGKTIIFDSDGDAFSAHYVYSSSTKRVETISGFDETQIVVPLFKPDFDLIYAVNVEQSMGLTASEDGSTVTLLDINADGRAWARAFNQ